MDKSEKTPIIERRKKTTHALPVSILERLRIYSAATGIDQQDVIAKLLDQHLPQNPFPQNSTDRVA
jgi:hypothetical protein